MWGPQRKTEHSSIGENDNITPQERQAYCKSYKTKHSRRKQVITDAKQWFQRNYCDALQETRKK